ncbi:Zf-C2H2-3 domain-containing protein [Fusarium falciforme]|uniref:Zf-C2H2-3 domain-containing protein n=1 Tax=Fusarium falciforme TaxID=195108 RepID=UPI0022FFDC45|nr:Zf-C2H2-3 domain-containing protein [Fusarium falciforme]WAO89079.1 Zf-C2H2-3 domain-containing protein [Fusarium falciforme]
MYADDSDSPWMASNLTLFRTNSSASSALRMRAKPLRTYGKRSTTRENSPREPSPKKRRISTEETSLKKRNFKSVDTESPSLPEITATGGKDSTEPTASDRNSPKDVVKKGSILNFFKPVSSSSSTVAPSPKSDEPQPESTPPSSPPQPPRIEPRRKPRILRFGGSSLPTISNEETESDVQDDDENVENREDGKGPARSPLKEQHTTNTTTTKPKKPKQQTVQTTLNISSQAPFSECKVCNTVWNPLYPDDVKYHTKQHAAVLRARKKKESEAL